MKLQCNACERAEAKVLCCADEAALCLACDEKVHAANKLAGKHLRVPLTGSASQVPKCDICKEASGYFFCLEDRALLCRKCDTAIHSVNSLVSAHQRFLLTGVKIGPEPCEPIPSTEEPYSPANKHIESPISQMHMNFSIPSSNDTCQVISNHDDQNERLPTAEGSFLGTSLNGNTYDWPPDDFFDFSNFNQNYGFIEHGSSKPDSGKLGSLENSPVCSSAEEEPENDLYYQVPEVPWTVPEMPSPPTASGLNWPKNLHGQLVKDSVFVPDICYNLEDLQQCQRSSPVTKRRRHW